MNIATNALFSCDALALLERLPPASVALVYLDPPWDTGSQFDSTHIQSIQKNGEQYTSYLSKVVQQVRRILSDTGSVFVHWSTISPLDIRLIVNQAFGDQPRYEITWPRMKIGHTAKRFPKIDNEFFLVYSKAESPIYNPVFRPLSTEEMARYRLTDSGGSFRVDSLTVPIHRTSLQFKWHGFHPPTRQSWRYSFEMLESLSSDNKIHFPPSGGMPRLKQYAIDCPGVELGTTWDDLASVLPKNERTGYPIQTPIAVMERIVKLASNFGDRVLDPFSGAGSALVAAHSLGRSWWGATSFLESHQIAVDRLASSFGLVAGGDYAVVAESEVLRWPTVTDSYRIVVASIDEIAALQKETHALAENLLALKRQMGIGEDGDPEKLENAVEEMGLWISNALAKRPMAVERYIEEVCSWLTGWDRLDKSSQSFLPQAEFLYENIASISGQDYSPFIIQYCRALENELLKKLFSAYTDNLYGRMPNIVEFLASDIGGEKTRKFAKALQSRENTYTLGDMNFIMGLMKLGGKTLGGSNLLQDFRQFTVHYFSERIVEKTYLDQIDRINKDFRCKAAHPYVLDAEIAHRCRDQVRACLNELILNYKGGQLG